MRSTLLVVAALLGLLNQACDEAFAARFRPRVERGGGSGKGGAVGAAAGVSYALGSDTDSANLVFTMQGQSLALGTNGGAALSTTSVYTNSQRIKTTYAFDKICEGTATMPTCSGTGNNLEYPITAMLDQIRATDGSATRNYVGQVRATSGAAYDDIEKGGIGTDYANTWDTSTGDVKQAYDAATGAAATLIVAAHTLKHGESDSDEAKCATYEANMVDHQSDTNTDAQTITGQSYTVPLFMRQVASEATSGATQYTDSPCALAQEQAATNNDPIFLVNGGYHCGSGSTTIYSGDGVHLLNSGYRCDAEMTGRAINAVLFDDWLWNPLLPVTVAASGSSITIDYTGHVPCTALGDCSGAPLVFDTTNVICPHTSDQEDSTTNCYMGFELECNSPSPPHLTGVSVSGAIVTLTANKTIPTGCTVSYAKSAIAGSLAGNGASTGYGSARGNLRDSTSTTGSRSSTTLYTWGAAWERSVSGGGSQVSTVATIIDDLAPTHAYVASTAIPADATSWWDVMGGYNMPYVSGTYTRGTTTHASIPAAAIGSGRIDNALDNAGGGCWSTGSGSSQFDRAANEDLMVVWLGKAERADTSYDYLFEFKGDVSTNNNIWFGINNTGGLGGVNNTGGANLTYIRSAVVPATPEWTSIVYYLDAKGHANSGIGQVHVCIGADCGTGTAASAFGATGTGTFSIMGAANCGAGDFIDVTSAVMIFRGEAARAAVAKNGPTVAEFADYVYDAYCPPGSQPCT